MIDGEVKGKQRCTWFPDNKLLFGEQLSAMKEEPDRQPDSAPMAQLWSLRCREQRVQGAAGGGGRGMGWLQLHGQAIIICHQLLCLRVVRPPNLLQPRLPHAGPTACSPNPSPCPCLCSPAPRPPPPTFAPRLQAPKQERGAPSNGRRLQLNVPAAPAPAPVAPPHVVVWTLAPVDTAPGVPASAKASVEQAVASINEAIRRVVAGLRAQAPGARCAAAQGLAGTASRGGQRGGKGGRAGEQPSRTRRMPTATLTSSWPTQQNAWRAPIVGLCMPPPAGPRSPPPLARCHPPPTPPHPLSHRPNRLRPPTHPPAHPPIQAGRV